MKELVIDVSNHDPNVDLAEWKRRRGIYGVIVNCGGYEVMVRGQGKIHHKNTLFETHYANAKAQNLSVGAYYYSTALTVEQAIEDADHCASLLQGHSFELPIYLDIEDSKQLTIGKRLLTDIILAFIQRLRIHGYNCGIYTYRSMLHECMYGEEFEPYPLWVAEYSNRCRTTLNHSMWQFGAMNIDGDVFWGDKSGYVDANWLYELHSSQSSNIVLLTVRQALAEVMLHLVNHDAHGYSQLAREGDGTIETIFLSDGTAVRIHGGDYDCSEAVRSCLAALGLVAYDYYESYMWTGNEPQVLEAAGFREIPPSQCGEGDVLLKSGHTEICVVVGGQLMDAGFRRSETHGIHGEQGDQDGLEGTYSPHPAYSWEHCYRYFGKERDGAGKPIQESEQTEDEMICLITPNGESYQIYCDGQKLHPLAHPDEAEALNRVYQATHGGKSIPSIKLGTKNAKWATRLSDALARVTTKV